MENVNCKLCGSSQKRTVLNGCQDYLENTPGKFSVVQCNDCKLFYLNPRPTAKDLAACYSSEYYAYQKPNLNKIKKRLLKLNNFPFKGILKERFRYPVRQHYSVFKKIFIRLAFFFFRPLFRGVLEYRGDGRILDIGCGAGLHLWFLKNLGWEPWGAEISPQACQIAKSLDINVFCGELPRANFPAQYFDVIRMNHVLEHLHSPQIYLKEIKRILKPEGICLIRVPNARSLNFKIFKKYWAGLDVPRHLYSFSPATLKAMFDKAGFKTKQISFVASSGTLLISLHFLFRDKGWKNQPWARFLLTNKGLRKVVLDSLCHLQNPIHLSDEIEAVFQLP
ncbi:class I SAM-dependent methyltransferase [Candidatus Omnitrophota bacterium]